MLESHAMSERRKGGRDESRAEDETRAEQKGESRGKSRNREKPAEFRAMNVKEMREPERCGEALLYRERTSAWCA